MNLSSPDKRVNILVPGRGFVNTAAIRVSKALEEYDERLIFGRNQETGQWCVFLKMPAEFEGASIGSQKVLPLYGWDDIPSVDAVMKKIWETDSLRQGDRILSEINKHNEKVKKVYEDAASDATGQLAEGLEWAKRKMGKHPNPRAFVPDKKETP